jgi:hypothetical protein
VIWLTALDLGWGDCHHQDGEPNLSPVRLQTILLSSPVANKLTGLLLFLTVPALFWSMIPIAIVAAMATFAAVQEGHFIRTKQVF